MGDPKRAPIVVPFPIGNTNYVIRRIQKRNGNRMCCVRVYSGTPMIIMLHYGIMFIIIIIFGLLSTYMICINIGLFLMSLIATMASIAFVAITRPIRRVRLDNKALYVLEWVSEYVYPIDDIHYVDCYVNYGFSIRQYSRGIRVIHVGLAPSELAELRRDLKAADIICTKKSWRIR